MRRCIDTKSVLLKKAYDLTDKHELLKYDCAALCGAACCKNHAANAESVSGMNLLPGEENLCVFDGAKVLKGADGNILICGGKCDRKLRPFMCRIFPFYAKFTKDENCGRTKISLVHDPRSFRICPIGAKNKGTRKSVYFLRYAKRAVRLLCNDGDFFSEFLKHSEYADSLYELYRKMLYQNNDKPE